MPELPEVEFARRCLERWLGGEKLVDVEAEKTRVVRGSPKPLSSLAGHVVEKVDRRGKWLLLTLDRGAGLVGHLGMTGKLVLQKPGEAPSRWSRARFHRRDGAVVHFQDPRMFGLLNAGPMSTLQELEGVASLGPDAWRDPPSADALAERLAGSKRPIKDALMDQTILAGVGNIQATEALHHAKIHPAMPANRLDRAALRKILAGVKWSLARTLKLDEGHDTISYVEEPGTENPFRIYGRDGEPCPRCGTELRAMTIAGRTSVWCPTCQPAPRGVRTTKRAKR